MIRNRCACAVHKFPQGVTDKHNALGIGAKQARLGQNDESIIS